MLRMIKKGTDKMKAVLDQAQSYLVEEEPSNAMEDYQKPLIPTTQTFIQFGKEVDNGLSPISGLLKYCHNAVNVVKSGVETNACNVPIVIHIGEKMAHTALCLRRVVSENDLSQDEQQLLVECELLASSWLANKQREALLRDVEDRVTIVKNNLSEGGVMHVLKNKGEVLGPLLSWA